MEGIMAFITCFGGNFAPRNWATCDGTILQISSNQALYSLLLNVYGGDGVSTFALPDLRGRAPVSAGQSPGTSNYALGQKSGTETVTLSLNNLPPHTHNGDVQLQLAASPDDGIDGTAKDGWPARFAGAYSPKPDSSLMIAPALTGTIANAGASQGVNTRLPCLAVNYIICTQGIYPSRN